MKRGSALVMALWTIAVLSVMVLSFAMEAHIETGINVYVRERNRVNRLVDAGRVLGEIVLVGYVDSPERNKDQDNAELLENDRWVLEKQALKSDQKCKIGPILLDSEDVSSGTITVEISPLDNKMNGGDAENGGGAININLLSKAGGDTKYQERWWMIFRLFGVPEEFQSEKDGKINLWNTLVAAWDDWCDDDDLVTAIDGEECGAERKWYEEYYEDEKIDEEDRRVPRNGAIDDVKELAFVRGFKDYPQILYGGVMNREQNKEDQIEVTGGGIIGMFTTYGDGKVNVNGATVDHLITIPGIYSDPDEEESLADARELAEAIVAAKKIEPDWEHDETLGEWPYRDFHDIESRLEDYGTDLHIGSEAAEYLTFQLSESTMFRMKIIGESMGMRHSVRAICYVKDKKVRYIEWSEEAENESDRR